LTETLLETELFGHEAGAFTGATRQHRGCFEQADGGTLVLDELGTIPLRMQEKILRVIEYGEVQRVGGSKTLTSDARIVGSTNENLPALAARGRFRADLLDRLAFDVIHVPPLRARPEDIEALAYHFAVNVTAELKREYFPGFAAGALAELMACGWPGNVRELKNTVERSIYRAEDPDEPIQRVLFDPFESPFAPAPGWAPAAGTTVAPPPGQATTPADASAESSGATRPAATRWPLDLRAAVSDYEKQLVAEALQRAHYKQTTAAELLGLSYHQLRGLLKKYGLPK
jgi:psp operon transcriptional activator